jgi:hypothetical protein
MEVALEVFKHFNTDLKVDKTYNFLTKSFLFSIWIVKLPFYLINFVWLDRILTLNTLLAKSVANATEGPTFVLNTNDST